MSASAPIVSCSFKVGHRTVSLNVPRPQPGQMVHAVFEWDPDVPARLDEDELRQYRDGRRAALVEIAEALQINVGVLDV